MSSLCIYMYIKTNKFGTCFGEKELNKIKYTNTDCHENSTLVVYYSLSGKKNIKVVF